MTEKNSKKARLHGVMTFCIFAMLNNSGCSAARLARLPWAQEVPGSNPGIPTIMGFPASHSELVHLLDENPEIITT